jgi:hypothetical protein
MVAFCFISAEVYFQTYVVDTDEKTNIFQIAKTKS